MDIISMYLPQFHRVKENDEWWGEGFTEWTAVKTAEKLYNNHEQPRKPMNDNYYDLIEKNTMEWQADLMRQYGIDGQCFYHYWFKDGRMILEKPAENLLRWKDINMKFCFCWANETWARSWSKLKEKNEWAFRFDKTERQGDLGILLEQQYGSEKDWKIHYSYLRQFFKDDRYIKHDKKPVFLIYKSRLIECLGEMLSCWNKLAVEDGFQGIYVIGANTDYNSEKYLDGILFHEPQSSMSSGFVESKIENGIIKYQYTDLWDNILSLIGSGKKVYYGGFVEYDDTPRRGKGGIVVQGASPEKFRKFLSELVAKNVCAGNEYVFLNAWNEWGEGMYLEPDVRNEYAYLEAVTYAKNNYEIFLEQYRKQDEDTPMSLYRKCNYYQKKVYQYRKYWEVFDIWMGLKERGINLEEYLIKHDINRIAIYGAGMMGRHLLAELSGRNVEVCYAIDKKAEIIELPIPTYRLEDEIDMVDAVIITVLSEVEGIRDELKKKMRCRIIWLKEMLLDLYEAT